MAGPERVLAHDLDLAAGALRRLARHPRIRLLGPLDVPRLAMLSFNVEGLHHDFVAALLDHLFGIQNRAGCSCAGPYGHRLLGIGPDRSSEYREAIACGRIGLKPGWVRLSLPYYATEDEVDFLLSAVELVADHGEAFVPLYRFGLDDGVWRPVGEAPPDPEPLRVDVEAVRRAAERGVPRPDPGDDVPEEKAAELRRSYLGEARRLSAELEARWRREPPRWEEPSVDPAVRKLAWFRWVRLA